MPECFVKLHLLGNKDLVGVLNLLAQVLLQKLVEAYLVLVAIT